ncbi:MAG: MarR family winged helix-turn-helix transcriptional regulator [Streptosporangiaceae bacterium]
MTDPVALPLGFWLRRVDELFESSMGTLLAGEGLSRRLWQVLNTVARHEPATVTECNEAMALFLTGTTPDSQPLLDELAGRAWLEASGGRYRLSAAGRSVLNTLEGKVAAHRAVMFDGISDADYRLTVETLARITANLDPGNTGPDSI